MSRRANGQRPVHAAGPASDVLRSLPGQRRPIETSLRSQSRRRENRSGKSRGANIEVMFVAMGWFQLMQQLTVGSGPAEFPALRMGCPEERSVCDPDRFESGRGFVSDDAVPVRVSGRGG